MKYSVVIVTFHKRFEEWLKPLVLSIKKQRPDVEVIVAVNGEVNYFNEEYRQKVLDFLKDQKNVFPIIYPRFRSLSRIWNLGVQFATEETVLVLSDDLSLDDDFFDEYENILKHKQTFAINISFSAISITKTDLINSGWFDERLLGMGWEDGDFMRKFKRFTGEKFLTTVMVTCKNIVNKEFYKVHNQKLEDYINTEVRLEGQRLDTKFGRYSEYNREIFEADLPYINQYPMESYYLENRHKL